MIRFKAEVYMVAHRVNIENGRNWDEGMAQDSLWSIVLNRGAEERVKPLCS